MSADATDQEETPEPALSPRLQQLLRAVQAEGRRYERDRELALSLYTELLGAPSAQRARLLAGDRRFASAALAEKLLAAAGAAARNGPAIAQDHCDLAFAVIARLDAEREGAGPIVALRAAAQIRRAEALWWGRECAQAEVVLLAALDDLEATPVGNLERALYCRVAALVRAGQGRVDEALALLTRASQLYRDQDERAELAACLTDRGWLLADEDPRAALLPLRRALTLLSEASHPWETVRARQGMALCQAELGHLSEAEATRGQAHALADRLEEAADRLRYNWVEAQIDARLGRCDRASAALPQVIEAWLDRGDGFLAALAMLDLAELYVEGERWPALAELDLLDPRLRAAGLSPEAALALRAVLGLARREPPAAAYPMAHLRVYLWRARHQQALPYLPCRAAAGAVRWNELPVELRREICERVGIGPQVASCAASAVAGDTRKLIAWAHQEATGVRVEWDGLDDLRARLRRAIEAVRAAQTELRVIAASIPLPADPEFEQIVTGKLPPSEAVLLAGAVDHTIAGHLEPAIRDLEDACVGRDLGRWSSRS